jgi:hypothetical protein
MFNRSFSTPLIIPLIAVLLTANAFISKGQIAGESTETARTTSEVSVKMFGHEFLFSYPDSILKLRSQKVDEKSYNAYYDAFLSQGGNSIVKQMLQYKEAMRLDDLVFYELVKRFTSILFEQESIHNVMLQWCILNAANYAVYPSRMGPKMNLYALACNEIEGGGCFKVGKGNYRYLGGHRTAFYGEYFEMDYKPIGRKCFSFAIQELPDPILLGQVYEKAINFKMGLASAKIIVKSHSNLDSITRLQPPNIPFRIVPFSQACLQSLRPFIDSNLEKLDDNREKIEFLLEFCRAVAPNVLDPDANGVEQYAQVAELTLLYGGDCEDKSALFFQLVKEFVPVPMVAIVYPRHINIGLHMKENNGDVIKYRGKKFSICETTGGNAFCGIGCQGISDLGDDMEVIYHWNLK